MFKWIVDNQKILEIWIGVGCTLGIYSILYKENKIYRFFEHLYIGLASGLPEKAKGAYGGGVAALQRLGEAGMSDYQRAFIQS